MTQTTHQTYCRICEALCGLEVDVEDGTVVAVRPDPKHPVSRGFVCVKGARFGEVHRDPDRLKHPMRRSGGAWQPASWNDAIASIGAELRRIRDEHGPHSIGVYFGNPSVFGYRAPIAMQGLMLGLGTRNVFSAGSQDCNNKFVVAEAMFGAATSQPIPDFGRMRFLLLLGTNPAVSQMSFVHAPRAMDKLRDIVDRGGRVVLVDPRRNETASHDFVEHHFIRPDTDAFLLAALAKRVVDRGLVDRKVVDAHASGYARLAAALGKVDLEACVDATGISLDTIDELATALGGGRAAIHMSTGANQGTSGALAYYLAQAIHLVTGNLDAEGGLVFPEHLFDIAKALKKLGADGARRASRVGGFRDVLGTLPAAILPDEILTPGEGQIRALLVLAGNPALSCANGARMQRALSQLDLLVTIDLYRNETSELGHYALPATDFFQREDVPISFLTNQPEPYLQWTDAVARPVGEQRDEWSILVDLCAASGIPFFGVPGLARVLGRTRRLGAWDPFHPRRAIDALLRIGGTSVAKLRQRPEGILRAPPRAGSFLGKRVLTADGRVDLAPEVLLGALSTLEARRASLGEVRRSGQLLLFTKREKTSHNSWMHNVPELVRGRRRTNYAYLHPSDAAARGITEGMSVRVKSRWGEIELPAQLDADVMPGSVAVPHGWGHQEARGLQVASGTLGVNVNLLAPDGPAHTDPIAGMSQLTGIPVVVAPAVAATAAAE